LAPFGIAIPVGPDGEPFFMYPFLTCAGGSTFVRDETGHLTQEFANVEAPRTVASLEYFQHLGRSGCKVLCPAADEVEAIRLSVDGLAPYLVLCGFALSDLRSSGIPYGVGPIPRAKGVSGGRPLVSVESFFLTRRGAGNPIARDWIECHLTRTDVAEAQQRP